MEGKQGHQGLTVKYNAESQRVRKLDVKRMQFPGFTLSGTCPKCGVLHEENYGDTYYLMYPKLDEPIEVTFLCNECDNEWTAGWMKARVSLEACDPPKADGASDE